MQFRKILLSLHKKRWGEGEKNTVLISPKNKAFIAHNYSRRFCSWEQKFLRQSLVQFRLPLCVMMTTWFHLPLSGVDSSHDALLKQLSSVTRKKLSRDSKDTPRNTTSGLVSLSVPSYSSTQTFTQQFRLCLRILSPLTLGYKLSLWWSRMWFNITGWHNAFNNAPG